MVTQQTVYGFALGVQPPGLLADGQNTHVESLVNGEATAIDFGLGVVLGSTDGEFVRPTTVSGGMYGVLVRTTRTLAGGQVAADCYGNVAKQGNVWVQPEAAVSRGAQVYMRITATGAEVVGSFRGDSDSGNAIPVDAIFLDAGTASVPARIMLLPKASSSGQAFSLSLVNASLTADLEDFLYTVPTGKVLVLDSATYYNATGLAADVSNYFNIKVQLDGGTRVAFNWSTQTSAQGALVADTASALVAGTLANRTFVGGERIDVMFDETGSATLPAGRVVVTGRLI